MHTPVDAFHRASITGTLNYPAEKAEYCVQQTLDNQGGDVYAELFFSVFEYLLAYKLLVCKMHRYCLLPCHLYTHLS